MSSPYLNSILIDANILVSQTLHTWVGLLAAEKLGQWHFYCTEDILAEALHARRKRFPITNSKQIEDIRKRLFAAGFKMIENYNIDNSVTYPDKFDAHVHSAAIHGNVGIIVTNNVKDFSKIYDDPDECPYEVYCADDFLMLAVESAPEAIDKVITQQFNYHTKHRKQFSLPRKLKKAGCDNFAEHVRSRLQCI